MFCSKFKNLYKFRNISTILNKKKIKIINVYCNIGQKKIGVEQGGFYIIQNFFNNDSTLFKNIMNMTCILINNKNDYNQLKNSVNKSLEKNEQIIILGGDHSITSASMPSFLEKYKNDSHILWIDAHADINTKTSSLTKNSHGMSLAKIFNLMENDVSQKYIPNFSQLTYLGLRDIDEFEKNIIIKNNIDIISISDIQNNNINYNNFNNKKLYISIDVDVLDYIDMPSTGVISKNGLLLDELLTCLNNICTNNNVKCIDIVEFNPLLGTKDQVNKSINNINKLLINLLKSI